MDPDASSSLSSTRATRSSARLTASASQDASPGGTGKKAKVSAASKTLASKAKAVSQPKKQGSNQKLSKASASSGSAAQGAAFSQQSPIGSLPEHLFVDILATLESHEIAQAATVCKAWSTVASTPYLWRHLSFITSDKRCEGKYVFTELKPGSKVPWEQIIARAKGNLVSVEFGYIAHHQVFKLARALKLKAASSLKHLRWSVPVNWMLWSITAAWVRDSTSRVLELAQACPKIATVEAMCHWTLKQPELFMGGALQSAKLERFRAEAALTDGVRAHLIPMLSQARVVILYATYEIHMHSESWMFDLLRANSGIEEFRIFGVSSNTQSSSLDEVTSVPSLRKLEWKPAAGVSGSEVILHAPNLRELSTDVRLLCKLSNQSLSSLSTLALDLSYETSLDMHRPSDPSASDGFQRILDYAGDLSLSYDDTLVSREIPALLELLSSDFIWPGLSYVSLTLINKNLFVDALPRAIAARKAAAQGASREQYMLLANSDEWKSQETTTYDGPPLCKSTHWRLNRCQILPPKILAWLHTLDNVSLYESEAHRTPLPKP